MRWYEWTALILVIALALTAFLFGTEWAANRLFHRAPNTAFHDTYYVVAHRHYMTSLALILLGGAAVFGLILRWGRPLIRTIASALTLAWGLCIALAAMPHQLLARQGMPRRYIELPDHVVTWAYVSKLAANLAALCACLLLALLAMTLFLRLRSRHRAG